MGWGVVDRNFFFFEFSLLDDFSPDKKKRKKVGWEYIFKVDILKWWYFLFSRIYILSE